MECLAMSLVLQLSLSSTELDYIFKNNNVLSPQKCTTALGQEEICHGCKQGLLVAIKNIRLSDRGNDRLHYGVMIKWQEDIRSSDGIKGVDAMKGVFFVCVGGMHLIKKVEGQIKGERELALNHDTYLVLLVMMERGKERCCSHGTLCQGSPMHFLFN